MNKWYFVSPIVLQKLIWVPTRLSLIFFGRLEVRGLENISQITKPGMAGAKPGSAIFACNHTSELDPILVPAALPFWSQFSPMFYASRESKFYQNSGWRKHIYGGFFFKVWGSYPVSVGLHDYKKAMVHQIRILNDGGSLCFFPEGRITPDGTIQPAKGGVVFLAHMTGRPIIPVRFSGTFRMSLKDLVLRRRRLSVTFGTPMYTSEALASRPGNVPALEDFKAYAGHVMATIGELQ